MTEPSAQRPVPGPPRSGPAPSAVPVPGSGSVPGPAPSAVPDPGSGRDPGTEDDRAGAPGAPPEGQRLAGLDGVPVAEHVAVFEAEHERLQRLLGTIDRH